MGNFYLHTVFLFKVILSYFVKKLKFPINGTMWASFPTGTELNLHQKKEYGETEQENGSAVLLFFICQSEHKLKEADLEAFFL